MQTSIEFIPILLFVITLLLAVIGFFLKQLHSVIEGLSETMGELKLNLEITKGDSKRGYESLRQITAEHSKRLIIHETKLDKHQEMIYELKKPEQ